MAAERPPSRSSDRSRQVSPARSLDNTDDVFADDNASEYAPSLVQPSDNLENPFADHHAAYAFQHTANEGFVNTPNDQPRHSISKARLSNDQPVYPTLPDITSSTLQPASSLPTHVRRRLSGASSTSFAPPQSPTASEIEPSHPYAMYPQVNVVRTPSQQGQMARRTASPRSLGGPQAPAHPYNLYPQDVSTTSDSSNASIPLGFPGHGVPQLHRRVGEEQDIVGVDGHLEQLPPYSRYPEATVSNKVASTMPIIGETPVAAEDVPTPPPESQPQLPQLPPPVLLPQTTPSTGSRTELSQTSSEIATVSSSDNMSEKPLVTDKRWKEKDWKEKARTRVCWFVPVWIMSVIVFVFAFVILIVGTGIGVYLTKRNAEKDNATPSAGDSETTTMDYIDAMPTSTPAGLPPLPTGMFIVPLGTPDKQHYQCLTATNQAFAWSCSLPKQQSICVSITNDDDRPVFSTCNDQGDYRYGAQPQLILTQSLKLVTDLDNQTLGPAWHFQTFYDKLVIIPKILLGDDAPSSALSKRYMLDPINIGDEAWFCQWDDTFVEGFIYASQNNPNPVVNYNPAVLYGEMGATTLGGVYKRSEDSYQYEPRRNADDDYPASEAIWPSSYYSSSWYSSSSSSSERKFEVSTSDGRVYTIYEDETSTTKSSRVSTTSTSASTIATTPGVTSTSAEPTSTAECIPKLVKIEERRLQGLHTPAVCTLKRRMEDLTFVVVNDVNEQPITVEILEVDGQNVPTSRYGRRAMDGSHKAVGGGAALERRQRSYVNIDVDESCYCQWTSETE